MQDRFKKEVNDESPSCKIFHYCSNLKDDVISVDIRKSMENSSQELKIFVKNSVNEAKRSDPTCWKHCP